MGCLGWIIGLPVIYGAIAIVVETGSGWWLIPYFIAVAVVFFMVVSGFDSSPTATDTHGSARFGEATDATRNDRVIDSLDNLQGRFILGGLDNNLLVHRGHVLAVAPTGSGKGIGLAVPNLLHYDGSAFVLDLKGELYAVTGDRRRDLGQRVYLLDPFGVTGDPGHAINWLDLLDPTNPEVVASAGALADLLVVPDAGARDNYFDEAARDLIRGLLIHLAGDPDPARRTVGELRRALTLNLDDELIGMSSSAAGFEIPIRAAASILAKADRERSGVFGSALRHTAFLDDPRLSAALSRSDIAVDALTADLSSVYLVIPPAKLQGAIRYVRGTVGLFLQSITTAAHPPPVPVALMLDEFAALGKLQVVEDGISIMRGYGAQFFLFVQDLSQLKAVYPRWQTFAANSGKVFFGTADFETAKLISDSLGQYTQGYETTSQSTGRGTAGNKTEGTAIAYTARHLLTPDEVMRLPSSRSIVMLAGDPPYAADRLNYLSDQDRFGQYAKENPFY